MASGCGMLGPVPAYPSSPTMPGAMASPRSGVAMRFAHASRLEPHAFLTTPITPLRFVLGRATRVYFHRRHGESHRDWRIRGGMGAIPARSASE